MVGSPSVTIYRNDSKVPVRTTVPAPNVKNIYHDPTRGVRYEVFSFRPLTKRELVFAVRFYLSQRCAKRLKRGMVVQILSVTGYND